MVSSAAVVALSAVLLLIQCAVAAASAAEQRQTGPIECIEVSGYHGCWHTIAAIHAAKTLKAKGLVQTIIVRRAGSQHVPTFADEDVAAFKAYTADMPHTADWDGQSPRIVIDRDAQSAMGASPFIRAFSQHFAGPADFGLPPMRDDLWRMALTEKALPLLAVAGLSRVPAFFSVDPPGEPLHGVRGAGGLLLYDDLDGRPTVYARHSLDPSVDPDLKALLDHVTSQLGLAMEDYAEYRNTYL